MHDPSLKRDKQRELALQILDIVALRPEMQLCYVGIETKCFEILETTTKDKNPDDESYLSWSAGSEADSEGEDQNTQGFGNDTDEDDETSSLGSPDEDDASSEEDEPNGVGQGESFFNLREILYYDDKISIFKARHCCL